MVDNGWIEWVGGECPVDENTNVLVRFRCGEERQKDEYIAAGGWYWQHSGDSYDIVAYRVVSDD